MSKNNYTIQTAINRPIADVFDAIVSESVICKYFAERTSGPLVEGTNVVWSWKDWGDYPVVVKKIVENERIELEFDSREWNKTTNTAYKISVAMGLESLGEDKTMLSISEQGWSTDESGLKGSHDNCSGWTHMAMCLKAFVEHNIDMR